jgi:hypothetical protein
MTTPPPLRPPPPPPTAATQPEAAACLPSRTDASYLQVSPVQDTAALAQHRPLHRPHLQHHRHPQSQHPLYVLLVLPMLQQLVCKVWLQASLCWGDVTAKAAAGLR